MVTDLNKLVYTKESTEIPKDVYTSVLNELHKERFYNLKKLRVKHVKNILKKLGMCHFYEHATHIICKLSGQQPPTINRKKKKKIRMMFRQVEIIFDKHCPAKRINFLSYSFILHKFFELLELDNFLHCFPLLKSRDKLRQQDKMWESICKELKWQFIPSI